MTTLDLELNVTPSDAVREVETQDGAVLLDIQQGLCLSMNPVGVMIWRQLKLNQSLDQVANCLAGKFPDVPQAQIHHDVVQFVENLKRNGLVRDYREPAQAKRLPRLLILLESRRRIPEDIRAARHSVPHFLFLKALLGLLFFDLFRFGRNFARLHRYVQTWPVMDVGAVPNDLVGQVCEAINRACVWYPRLVLCLQRSAVTTCLLRSGGVPAQMVMGAQKFPFKAHAWTEVDGRAINERRDVANVYLIWERC